MKIGFDEIPGVPVQHFECRAYAAARDEIPAWIAREVYAEYTRQYGTDQSFERMHERGGFGVIEAMHLLCQALDRARGKPLRRIDGAP